MKTKIIVNTALSVLAIAGATYLVKPTLFENILFEGPGGDNMSDSLKLPSAGTTGVASLIKGSDWADCAAVRSKVAEEISRKTEGMNAEQIVEFSKSPENRLLLAQWVVADAELRSMEEVTKSTTERSKEIEKLTKELEEEKASYPKGVELPAATAWNLKKKKEKLARLQQEQQSAHLMSENVTAEGGSALLDKLSSDPNWLELLAFSGECVRPGMAVSILQKIAAKHRDMTDNFMVRDIATATALEYAKSNWNQQDAVDRADFYINAWKSNRLNTIFDSLPMWQRRMVCGCKGDNDYGSLDSLKWSLDNVHIPGDQYTGACWRADYRLNNIYGDSIHGPLYYAPFESALGNNRSAMTYYIGGVCGSLSHFGAFAALANGVPAMTSGEPGHCSYIVLTNNKWTPAYSLDWRRGLHWQVFRDVYTFSSLHAATELYSPEQKDITDRSNALRVIAGVQAGKGNLNRATETYCQAVTTQPLNWMAWREWKEALLNNPSTTADHWDKLNDTLCTKLVPIYPEMAAEHMMKGVLAGMADAMKQSPERLRNACLKFWKNIAVTGPDRWRVEELANKQLNVQGISHKNIDPLCSYFGDVLNILITNSEYAPIILGWGNELNGKLDETGRNKLMASIISSLGTTGSMSKEERIKLLSPAVLAAEANRDMSAFRALGNMIREMGYKNPDIKIPKFEPFPGKLASEGGLVWANTTSQWDKPYEHAGLLTPEGGSFHTSKDKDPSLTVQLPRQVYVTGVVIVCNPGQNLHRCNNMKIQVSENGTDWTDVQQLGTCKQRVMRADLSSKLPLAKYVRIIRTGGPDFFHLNAVYVYGNQAA